MMFCDIVCLNFLFINSVGELPIVVKDEFFRLFFVKLLIFCIFAAAWLYGHC